MECEASSVLVARSFAILASRSVIPGPVRTALVALTLGLGALSAGLPAQAHATHTSEASAGHAARAGHARPRHARVGPSGVVAQMADWIVSSGDSGGRPFIIIDKKAADVFVFDAHGALQGAAPVLLGLMKGDTSAPGVGNRDLAAIPPQQRTTPAGRFVASFGAASGHDRMLWVDYADAISLHPVVTANPKERRLERLRSPAPKDRRISFGCINVPTAFYQHVVLKAFARGGIVYILPDTKPLEQVFPAFAVAVRESAATKVAPGEQAAASSPPQRQPDEPSGGDSPR